jgi:hypothetical protein
MAKRKPTEFAINMNLEKLMILQQPELKAVNDQNYFDESNPCHIYFIGKRPRISIDPDDFTINNETLDFHFNIQYGNSFQKRALRLRNDMGTSNVRMVSQYPFTTFTLYEKDTNAQLFFGKSALVLQQFASNDRDCIDLEILYIGQSYGVDGARTAPDRLQSHSTLQAIYAEATSNNPDSEIWLALASFEQINLMMMDGRTGFTEEELAFDKADFKRVFSTLNYGGINEQQKINFTEAALIKYFQPRYNKIYKDSFPNPAHETYRDCYDLDINSVCIELQTMEMANCKFYSDVVERAPWHMHDFLLHSAVERKSMFEIDF